MPGDKGWQGARWSGEPSGGGTASCAGRCPSAAPSACQLVSRRIQGSAGHVGQCIQRTTHQYPPPAWPCTAPGSRTSIPCTPFPYPAPTPIELRAEKRVTQNKGHPANGSESGQSSRVHPSVYSKRRQQRPWGDAILFCPEQTLFLRSPSRQDAVLPPSTPSPPLPFSSSPTAIG